MKKCLRLRGSPGNVEQLQLKCGFISILNLFSNGPTTTTTCCCSCCCCRSHNNKWIKLRVKFYACLSVSNCWLEFLSALHRQQQKLLKPETCNKTTCFKFIFMPSGSVWLGLAATVLIPRFPDKKKRLNIATTQFTDIPTAKCFNFVCRDLLTLCLLVLLPPSL